MLKMVTDDDTPVQNDGGWRILYAMRPDETPNVRSIRLQSISFAENAATPPGIFKLSL